MEYDVCSDSVLILLINFKYNLAFCPSLNCLLALSITGKEDERVFSIHSISG